MRGATLVVAFLFLSLAGPARAAEILTNEVHMTDAPGWLKSSRVERITAKVERELEWDIRRVTVRWFLEQDEFEQAHGLGPLPRAASDRHGNTIFLGPRVNDDNFDGVFAHELSHIVMFQKYKDAIPKWLEEGIANYVAGRGSVDYKELAKAQIPKVSTMGHPFKSSNPELQYKISTALLEMISSRCRFNDLLQLSVGRKLETYLDTFCGIPDIDKALSDWIARKAK